MYYSCHCIKRNGLQHDCRRTGCGGEPACLTQPDPVCAPSQLARARGLAGPAPLQGHMHQGSSGGAGPSGNHHGSGSGKKFIVCELKGIVPDVSVSSDKSGKCCKCRPASYGASHGIAQGASCCGSQFPRQDMKAGHYSGGAAACVSNHPHREQPLRSQGSSKCCPCAPCTSASARPSNDKTMLVLDGHMAAKILQQFEQKNLAGRDNVYGGGGRGQRTAAPKKEQPCTRPGCVHWQPPPPCIWDLPCKADCFEAPAGIQPGRNPLVSGHGHGQDHGHNHGHGHGHGHGQAHHSYNSSPPQPHQRIKLLTPECCTGCCVPSDGGAPTSGGPADGMPVMVLKLC